MVGTFWISGKGGILEKGMGVDLEKGGYEPPSPPLPTMLIVHHCLKKLLTQRN